MVEIYGTLGPACSDAAVLKAMFEEGMTGMRLNLSHGSLRDGAKLIESFHDAEKAAGIRADLLIDMQGPELRVGTMAEEMSLEEGGEVILSENGTGIPIPEGLAEHIDEGDEILLDDGILELKVLSRVSDKKEVTAKVLRGGVLRSRKSIKIVDKPVYGPALTKQDRLNLADAAAYGVTSVMQPFVRSGQDLAEVREELEKNSLGQLRIFAKIENKEGIENLREIAKEADMVVIARGDLGNDMPLWELPAAQKKIEKICLEMDRPFLVVTQMLSSMVHSKVPTRAEVSDIFNAAADGAAAVMVTNETAVGDYPADVIRYLAKAAQAGEAWRKQSSRGE